MLKIPLSINVYPLVYFCVCIDRLIDRSIDYLIKIADNWIDPQRVNRDIFDKLTMFFKYHVPSGNRRS